MLTPPRSVFRDSETMNQRHKSHIAFQSFLVEIKGQARARLSPSRVVQEFVFCVAQIRWNGKSNMKRRKTFALCALLIQTLQALALTSRRRANGLYSQWLIPRCASVSPWSTLDERLWRVSLPTFAMTNWPVNETSNYLHDMTKFPNNSAVCLVALLLLEQ